MTRKICRCCAVLTAVAACRGDSDPPREPHVETAIARELTARWQTPLAVHCELPMPACHVELPDGSVLPVRLAPDRSGWTWQLVDRVVDTQPIARYVEAMLADLHVAQTASCGARVRRVAAGERLACPLSGGGTAFVEIGNDGALSVELALDHAAAAARGEPLSPEREHELDQKSRALDHGADGDEP